MCRAPLLLKLQEMAVPTIVQFPGLVGIVAARFLPGELAGSILRQLHVRALEPGGPPSVVQ